jgi:hypothetical protein
LRSNARLIACSKFNGALKTNAAEGFASGMDAAVFAAMSPRLLANNASDSKLVQNKFKFN